MYFCPVVGLGWQGQSPAQQGRSDGVELRDHGMAGVTAAKHFASRAGLTWAAQLETDVGAERGRKLKGRKAHF